VNRLASSVTLSWDEGVTIDGIRFPFWVGEDVGIEPGGSDALTVVNLPLLVWGTVVMHDRGGKRGKVVDQELGDVGEGARALVRTGLLERLPWLKVPLTPAPTLPERERGDERG